MAFLRAGGLRIPEDVQIIGYDGLADYATGTYSCSTIVQPITRMAETAVDLLLNPEELETAANVCLPVEYAFGGTTKR